MARRKKDNIQEKKIKSEKTSGKVRKKNVKKNTAKNESQEAAKSYPLAVDLKESLLSEMRNAG